MNNCKICFSAEKCHSAYQSTNEMYDYTREMGMTTIFDRYQAQQPQCGFGMQGICCH